MRYKITDQNKLEMKEVVQPYLGTVNSLNSTPKFEFLMANCQNGIALIKLENFEIFSVFRTDHPVMSSKLSPLVYSSISPKYHLIFGGGIDVMEQAYAQEGGNEVIIYDIRTCQKLCQIGGCNARINDLAIFPDGTGLIAANADGKATIFRFDIGYYDKENWNAE